MPFEIKCEPLIGPSQRQRTNFDDLIEQTKETCELARQVKASAQNLISILCGPELTNSAPQSVPGTPPAECSYSELRANISVINGYLNDIQHQIERL